MMMNPVDEIQFWSGIMRDHAEFFLTALSSREPDFIRAAQAFKDEFASLEREAAGMAAGASPGAVEALAERAMAVLIPFIDYKRAALCRLLQCRIEVNFPPTFVNHMINEAMDFYRTLCKIQSPAVPDPVAENILLHKIWLPDAAGHAATIAADLDPTEAELIKKAQEFKKTFESLFLKATELGMMLQRTGLKDGALDYLNEQAAEKITEFICFLQRILDLRSKCKALGIIKPLVPDHMIREENYYLANLRKVQMEREGCR